MAEHIGDHTALSAIIDKDLLKKPGLNRTLLGDGLATFVAGALGGPANTTYGENTSVVGMTKVASVWVIGLAAILAICLGFLGKFTAIVSTIPGAVLGGVSLILYGFIAVNGLKVLIQNQVDFNRPKNVVVAATMLVLGLGGAAISIVYGDLAITISGMSLAAIIGILLNLCIPERKEDRAEEEKNNIIKSAKEEIKKEVKEEILAEIKEEIVGKVVAAAIAPAKATKKPAAKKTTKTTTKAAAKTTAKKPVAVKKTTTTKKAESKPVKKVTKTQPKKAAAKKTTTKKK